jgi:hypothetical protein
MIIIKRKRRPMNNQINLFNQGLEKYPASIVITENLAIILWLLFGTMILFQVSIILGIVYVTAALIMILFVMRKLICTKCYYYGKRCHVGWGKISGLLFKEGAIEEFTGCPGQKVAPLLFGLLALLPVVFGIISMVRDFSVYKIVLFSLLIVVVVYSSVISRKNSCAKCKMRLVCPGSAA